MDEAVFQLDSRLTHSSKEYVLAASNRLVAVGKTLSYKRYEKDFPYVYLNSIWHDTLQSTFAIENIYVVQTATKVIQRCLLMTTDPGDLVLDPTCGAVSIGPEYGTVGTQQVKEAAKEAVQGLGFQLLIICGFARDPHVAEEVKRYKKPKVLYCQMNPDLAMGNELLKKTKAGNLFMVFGEPDIEIRHQKNDEIVVEINGIDVYDPTTGVIRSSSTDDIACWFIDTNYNGESFFVRHAYFTGADEPYDKLKRALKAEIDEQAWSSIYSTLSRPFKKPETGKIAIKVINHYGDEVLKVFDISAETATRQKSIRLTNAAFSIKKGKGKGRSKKPSP